MPKTQKNLVELFGYSAADLSKNARALWNIGACPFIARPCTKTNHDKSVVYGTCSVTSPYGDCIICPNRLYENNYAVLKRIATDAFGAGKLFLTYEAYVQSRASVNACVVALGQNSGKEVKLGRNLSMDWVLAHIQDGKLFAYVGVEVQSIDITGNYRDAWYAYKNLRPGENVTTASEHGLNWANVHKRLIPQLIRKGLIYSRSERVVSGLYFIIPEIVYRKFEDILGKDIPLVEDKARNVLTVHTYALSDSMPHGEQRQLVPVRTLHFNLDDFSQRFIAGASLPAGNEMDLAVCRALGTNAR